MLELHGEEGDRVGGQLRVKSDLSVAPSPWARLPCQPRSRIKVIARGSVEILRLSQRTPSGLGIRVMLVDSLDPRRGGFGRLRENDPHALLHDRVSWKRVIHEQYRDAGVLARDPGVHRVMQPVNQQAFVSKSVQQLE